MAKTKSDIDIQEKDTKTKPKKTKKVETLDSIKVDVEIDLRNESKQPCVYIRRKRSI